MNKKFNLILLILAFSPYLLLSQISAPLNNYGSFELTKAKSLFDDGLLRKSEHYLKEAIKLFPDAVDKDNVILLQSMIDQAHGNYKIAEIALYRFIKENPNSPIISLAAMQRAYIAFEQKNYDLAEKLFGEAKRIVESEYQKRKIPKLLEFANSCLYWRGVSLAQRGKYQEALPYFEECYNKYQNGNLADDALFALGMSEELNRHFESAITYYRTLQKNYPYSNTIIAAKIREVNNDLILKDPSSALILIDNTDNILKHINSKDSVGLLFEPQSYAENASEEVMYLKGESYNLSSNFDKAESFFSGFLETFISSDLTNYVRLGLAWALLNKNEFEESIKTYDKIIETETKPESRVKSLAQLYRSIAIKKTGDVASAQRELSQLSVESGFPFISHVLLELGQIYYESGEYVKATKTLDRAERDATDALVQIRIQLLLGASYIAQKKWDKAIIYYKTAEQMALKSNYIFMPQKEFFIAESRLKLGIALVCNSRNSEAISPLLAYLSDLKHSTRSDEALFWLAEAYYRSDLLKNSSEKYSSIIELYPNSSYREEALYGLGWSYFRLENFAKSSEVFEQMIKEFPKTKFALEVLTRQGDGYYINKVYRKAIDSYRRAAQLAPNTEEGQYSSYQLAHALYKLEQYDDAIGALMAFVRNYPKSEYSPYALYLTGWIRFTQKKYTESIDDLNFLIQAYPQSILLPKAYFAIADAYYNLNKFDEAISSYTKVLDDYPTSQLAPEAIRSIQYCYSALGKDEEALKIADKYILSNPNSPYAADFIFKKGEMFYTGKNYNDAVSEYDSFLKKYPDSEKSAEAIFWMAKSYQNLNDPEHADKAFKQITDKYPKSDYAPQSLLERSLLKKQMADLNAADSLLNEAQTKYPENTIAAQAGYERALIKFTREDFNGAVELLKEISTKYKGTEFAGQSNYRLGMYYRQKGWLDSAISQFEIISAQNYNPLLASEAQFRIGEIYLRSNEIKKAIDAFTIVKEKFAGYEDWFTLSVLNLGECYEKNEQIDKAIEQYQAISVLRPDDDFGKTAKRRLKDLEKK